MTNAIIYACTGVPTSATTMTTQRSNPTTIAPLTTQRKNPTLATTVTPKMGTLPAFTNKRDHFVTDNAPAFYKNNGNNNNNDNSGGAHVDLTALVICITLVVIVAIVACAVVVLRSRSRKRGEVEFDSPMDASNAFIVEGTVESVVDDTSVSFDVEGEQQND